MIFKNINHYRYSIFAIFALMYLVLLPMLTFPVTSILKPLPILVLLTALWHSALYWFSKVMLAIAVIFSILGDIALTLPLKHQLIMGLGLFLIAHVAYIGGFLSLAKWGTASIRSQLVQRLIAIAFIIIASSALLVLWPYLGALNIAVSVYILVVTFMAISTIRCHFFCLMGGSLFLLSDGMIAIEQFIIKEPSLNFWVMFSYYVAQFFLIYGAIHMGRFADKQHAK